MGAERELEVTLQDQANMLEVNISIHISVRAAVVGLSFLNRTFSEKFIIASFLFRLSAHGNHNLRYQDIPPSEEKIKENSFLRLR